MSKLLDALVVGELNVDIILNNIDSFPEVGKEKLAANMDITLGSSSAIFASNLSSLGAKVGFAGKLGKDSFGDFVIESLNEKGVDTQFVVQQAGLNTGATIVLNFAEDRANVTHPGAMEALTIEDIKKIDLESAKHLHFSSFFLQPGIRNNVDQMFKLAKEKGLSTSLDVQWDPEEKWEISLKRILPLVDIFFPNEQELQFLTGKNDVKEAINEVKRYANTVVLKQSSKGSLMFNKGDLNSIGAFKNDRVIDAIGAGDSFNAGFIFKYLSGHSKEECQEFGNLTGAINTTAAGGTTAFTNYTEIIQLARERFNYKGK